MRARPLASSLFSRQKSGDRLRAATGSGFLELAVALIFMTAMLLFALDICMVLIAFGVNDRACRDAARAAAQGRNTGEALKLAKAALRQHATSSALIEKPRLVENQFAYVTSPPPKGKPSEPFVSVTTVTNTRVPAPIFLVGQNFGGGRIAIARRYIYPIVKLSQR
jgi:Flp pilus assembly protein TadG